MNEQQASPVLDRVAPPRRRRARLTALGVAAALLLTTGAGAGAWAAGGTGSRGATTTAQGGAWTGPGASGSGGSGGQGFGPSSPGGSNAFDGTGSSASGSAAVDSTAADAAQTRGVVTIVSELGYEDGEAAGTGIVLTSGGRILTNHHVVAGATAIRVTDETTGRTYTARVVGTDAAEDVAVLQLQDASGLATATIATGSAAVGDAVTAVGNAEGTGTLTAAEGAVTGLDQRITTQSEGNAAGETLEGLIETSADVVSGDSGGPLRDEDGAVVGIDTAATSGGSDITGYAIPIATAVAVADRIVAGQETDGVALGYPAFLGVSISADGSADGALVAGALDGTPAAAAGLGAGDVITAVDGSAVASGEALTEALAQHEPGDRVRIAWTDATGAARTATVVLAEGPVA